MLEPTKPASWGATSEPERATSATIALGDAAVTSVTYDTNGFARASGTRSSRHKRGLLRRTGIVIPALGLALLLVAVVATAAYVLSPRGGASGLAAAIDAIPQNHSIALLEQERQTLIDMSDAARTLTVASKPATVSPADMTAAQQAGSSSGSDSSVGVTEVSAPAPDPGTAQSIAYGLLPSFGFSQSSQWGCLLDIWNRESGWNYQAENPVSGAYGIPQALPGDKMASAGADWQTDPTTQIKWGLGYIKSVYGSPCAAWDFELANGYY
jgi:hypothetical protein